MEENMNAKMVLTAAVICLSVGAAHADESALALGKSAYGALCAGCHGEDAKGGGEVGQLFEVAPADLTKISERAGGRFPFADVYHVIILGMEAPGHGPSEMPIWGDFF
jgi:mono/diheme cytochrome c family protein